MGRQFWTVVSMLAFYCDDLSSNPTEVYNFSVKLNLKRTKINQIGRDWPIFQKNIAIIIGAVSYGPWFRYVGTVVGRLRS